MATNEESSSSSTASTGASDKPVTESTSPAPARSGSIIQKLRLPLLLIILVALLAATWYDHRVARPAVDAAYDIVSSLHSKHSGSADMPILTTQLVQQALNTAPAYTVKKHSYTVEVYTWTAGLPFRSHDLYCVYSGHGVRFARHYKFVLPEDDLDPGKGGPKLASVKPTGSGPNPYEAVDHQDTNPDQATDEGDGEENPAGDGGMLEGTAP